MHRTKRRVASHVKQNRRKAGKTRESRVSSKLLADVNKNGDLQANSAPRLVTRTRQLNRKAGISSSPAKHSIGELRLYECSRTVKRHWVCQSKYQKPRGGSRGAVTRIFPAVSPGRGGVVRGNLLVRPPACQLRSAPGSDRAADLIQSKGR